MTSLPDLLSELRALEAKATKGPWATDYFGITAHWPKGDFHVCIDCLNAEGKANAALIVALRNNLLTLLSTIEELQGRFGLEANDG